MRRNRTALLALAVVGLLVAPASAQASENLPEVVAIPDVHLTKAAGGLRTLPLLFDSGQYDQQPAVPGQQCNLDAPSGLPVLGGRQWMWAQPTDDLDQYSVTVVVTDWFNGEVAMSEVQTDTGQCRWADTMRVVKSKTVPGQSYVATARSTGLTYAVASVRDGDRMISTQVYSPKGRQDAVKRAQAITKATAAQVALP